MQKLINLVQIISRSKVKNIEVITDSGDSSILAKFYRGIADGTIKTHDDIQLRLYKRAIDSTVINKLKENLYKRLINTAFFIDTKKTAFTDYQKAFFYINKQYTAFLLLSNRGLNKNVLLDIGDSLLKKALKYDFTEIIIGIARIIASTHAINGKVKKRENIQKLISEQIEVLNIEIKARDYYNTIIEEYVGHRGASKILSEKAGRYYLELKPIIKKYPTYNLGFNTYMLGIYKYILINDYKNILKVCTEAITFFENKGGEFNLMSSFYIEKLNCCIYYKLYEQGEALIPKILSLTQEGSHNWFKNKELHIKLYLYSGRYDEAYTVLIDTMDHPKFKTLLDNYREFWKVCEVYIYILMQLSIVKRKEKDGKNKYFKLTTFVNDVPVFAVDKRGMNIPIIIAQILYFIVKKDFVAVGERMQAIDQYCERHLKKMDSDFRSFYFIKMLLTFQECGYNKKRVEYRIQRFQKKFEEVPVETKNMEIEILPYEVLLDIVYRLIE